MSAMSEACPVCGTATHPSVEKESLQPQSSDYVRRSDVKLLDGLKETMDSMLYNKQSDPSSNIVVTTAEDGRIDGREIWVDWVIGVPQQYTNKPTITLYFWGKTPEDKERIKGLENASIFSQEDYDCGTNTEKAAYLFSEYVRLVWGFDGEVEFEEMVFEQANYNAVELYLDKDAFDEWNELCALVKSYNATAKESDYPTLTTDKKQHLFKGSFPTDKKVGGFLSKSGKMHKKLKADFDKIIDLCETFLAE